MPRNIEIKARVADPAALARAAAALATSGPELLHQDDTFFRCAHGRLKLRVFGPGDGGAVPAELIFDRRADQGGPKESSYVISRTDEPGTLREALAGACGLLGRVRKRRTLWLAGRTRIHLDEVEGLGHFVELEVVLAEDEPATQGEAEARDLMRRLGIAEATLVEGAYLDLLRRSRPVTG